MLAALLATLLMALLVACGEEDKPATDSSPISSPPTSVATNESQAAEPTPESTLPPAPTAADDGSYAALREEMVQSGVIGWGVKDETVIAAMLAVPRHEFVPEEYREMAYRNHPLPIGFGQTISQPYMVAKMTESIEVEAGDKVLEIGTGSGYQSAVLAEVVDVVYTVEIIGELLEIARETHERVGYDNIVSLNADGYFGWEEHGPFDAIIVTAAPDHVPTPLVQQLKIGGRMIIPVGPVGGFQRLWLVKRVSEDEVTTTNLGDVRFVPLTRGTQ